MLHDWLKDAQVDDFVGQGPIITDDHPRSEYYLLHVLAAKDHSWVTEQQLLALRPTAAG